MKYVELYGMCIYEMAKIFFKFIFFSMENFIDNKLIKY